MKSKEQKVVTTKDNVKEIMTLIANAVKDSYGVDVITSNSKKKGNEENILVNVHGNQTFDVDVHVSVAKGVKITEALYECQKLIKYRLDRKFKGLCNKVNVYAMKISSK